MMSAKAQGTAPFPAPTGGKLAGAWIAVAAWIALIQTLGGEQFSASETSRFLGPLLQWLFPDAGPELLATTQHFIRKSAHVVEYGVLAVLSLNAFRLSADRSTRWLTTSSTALVLTVAVIDETRQVFSPNRGGALADVLLDCAGAIAALGIVWVLRRRFGQ